MRITEYSTDGVNWCRISDEVGSLRAFIAANPRATIRSRDVPDQHSPATYVEGREAPAFRFDNDPSWPNSDGLDGGLSVYYIDAPELYGDAWPKGGAAKGAGR